MKDQATIDRYLLDELDAAERRAFETRLQRDPELAEHVRFQQTLQTHFNQDQPLLTQTLTAFGEEFFLTAPTPPTTKHHTIPRRSRWWLLLLLAPFALFIWWLNTDLFNTTAPTIPTPVEQPTVQPAPPTVAPTPPAAPEDFLPSIPETPTPSPATPSRPIAALPTADYSINPTLEGLIREQLRGSETTLRSPRNEATLDAEAPRLTVSGTATTTPPYTLLVYTNQPTAFDNDYPTLRHQLNAKRDGLTYTFLFDARLDLTPGRYYLLLQNTTGDLMDIRTFSVR